MFHRLKDPRPEMESHRAAQEYKCKQRIQLHVITSKYSVGTQYLFHQKEHLNSSVKISACSVRKEISIKTMTQVAITRIYQNIL